MRFSKDLIGKPIVSIDEGRHVGIVKDIYLDPDLEWLAGIHLGKEGLLSRKSLLIPRESIAVFGVDFVLTKGSDVITDEKELAEAAQWLRLDRLQGREVATTGGTKVGTIGDALLDEEARIIGFSLARVFVEGPVAESRSIYQNAIVDKGTVNGVMTVDLALVERQSQKSDEIAVETPLVEATAVEEPEEPIEPARKEAVETSESEGPAPEALGE